MEHHTYKSPKQRVKVKKPTTHVSALAIPAPGNNLAELEVEAFSRVLRLDGQRRFLLAAKGQFHLTAKTTTTTITITMTMGTDIDDDDDDDNYDMDDGNDNSIDTTGQ